MDDKIRERTKKYYKQCTDQIFLLRESFKESGFTDEEAFELTNTYVRQTLFDNILRDTVKNRSRAHTNEFLRERLKKFNEENTNDQT